MLACSVYFWSRVVHFIIYAIGIPVLRTVAFTVGFIAQVVLLIAIFRPI